MSNRYFVANKCYNVCITKSPGLIVSLLQTDFQKLKPCNKVTETEITVFNINLSSLATDPPYIIITITPTDP